MQLILLVLLLLIKGLIAIGDAVLYGGRFLVTPVAKITASKRTVHPFTFIKVKLFTFRAKREQTLLKKPSSSLRSQKALALLRGFFAAPFAYLQKTLRRFFHILHAPKKKKQGKTLPKKAVKPQPLSFFHLSFFIKVKYFFAGIVFSLIFIFFPLLTVIFLQDLPNPKTLSLGQIPQTTKIYDRSGTTLLYQIYGAQNRTLVPLSDIPLSLQQATIATEDKDFYSHPGFDISAIVRSALENASGKNLQGGSTLTQQLIKSALLTPETSMMRKVKEAILAFWAERIYTKNQILEMYFNQIPYGGTAWGVQAAAEVYFGKSVKDLDLAQSAFLAGIPRAPTIYSPDRKSVV